jgi:hypothetical protein
VSGSSLNFFDFLKLIRSFK